MTRPRLIVLCCTVALLPLAGCGGGDEPSAGGAPTGAEAELPADVPVDADVPTETPAVDPCSLVSNEAMAGILTEQFPSDEGDVTVTSQPLGVLGTTCEYSWTRSSWGEGSGKEFAVAVLAPTDLEYAAAIGERTPIDGVGDEAFEVSENYFARVGDTVVHVVNLETPEASVAVLAAAAGAL
ncbi:hypothetical protein [Modestobacter sp. I12A-02662]|uniref:hypothetical protein n=1 Tax=Modestobacter sp. I12A-02662 TaxID=1730496 RepID=UPI0034E00AFF